MLSQPLTRRRLGALGGILAASTARAQATYPSRPVTLMIGFSPGGSGDATLRFIADAASRRFGVPVVVENRPGAGGTISLERAARAAPDGHTLVFLNNSVITVTPNVQRVPYDPARDFTFLARYLTAPLPAYVATTSRFRTWDELVAWARANPGRLTWATAAVNGAAHIVTAAAFNHLGIDAVNVPFSGMSLATAALLGGQIDLCVATDYPPLLAAGQVRLLAEIGSEPARSMPDVPTFGRMGYGHTYGLRRLSGETQPLTEEETARREALQAEFDRLEQDCAEADEGPEETDRRLAEIEEALAAFEDRPVAYDTEEMARAGAFVSIDGSGALRVERGYVRPEDEPPVAAEPEQEQVETRQPAADPGTEGEPTAQPDAGAATAPAEPPEEDEGIRPLPDRLLTELTAHRTLALRDALAADPQVAFLAALHALCLKLFYRYGLDSCLEIEPKSALFSAQAPGLADTASARAIEARHARWQAQMPAEPGELWPVLAGFDADSREALFAHCVGLTVNAVHEAYNRRSKAIAHADRIAEAVSLDMAAVGCGRRRRAISAASPRAASSPPCGRRAGRGRRSASPA